MIQRPENLRRVDTEIIFNMRQFDGLEMDLEHININERSSFTSDEISEVVSAFIDGKYLHPSDTKKFDDEYCSYFAKTDIFSGKSYRLVFCVCSDRPTKIGIITLYRVRG